MKGTTVLLIVICIILICIIFNQQGTIQTLAENCSKTEVPTEIISENLALPGFSLN